MQTSQAEREQRGRGWRKECSVEVGFEGSLPRRFEPTQDGDGGVAAGCLGEEVQGSGNGKHKGSEAGNCLVRGDAGGGKGLVNGQVWVKPWVPIGG